ncbi:hypothetical protein Nmel_011845 [Mimus melanotis]
MQEYLQDTSWVVLGVLPKARCYDVLQVTLERCPRKIE